MERSTLWQTDFKDVALKRRGKVRDIYEVDGNLLIIATDRLSAFDVVLPDGIPQKGKVLNQLSAFWFKVLEDIIPHHMIATELNGFPGLPAGISRAVEGRAMIVRKTRPLAVECVVRGYLSGSAWAEYQEKGSVCGIPLPRGLKESDRLERPIFTPSTKAAAGEHDENIDFAGAVKVIGEKRAGEVRTAAIQIYERAASLSEKRGILIADTKLEFGEDENGRLILIDEALTPDSSRFWPAAEYSPGGPQKSFDKQFVRDYLLSIRWDKNPPAPRLPGEVIRKTSERYVEAYERLTGKRLQG